jgi:hypothetical protein
MKLKFAFASLLVLSACGTSREALEALDLMQFRENATVPGFSYSKLSGSGNDVKLEGVSFLSSPFMATMMGMETPETADASAPTAVLTAESVVMNGLTMKDGKPLVRDIVLSGISPAGNLGGATITIGSVGMQGLDEATGAFIAGAFTEAGPGEPPPFEQWAFSRAGVDDIAVKGEFDGPEGLASFDVKVGELSVSNLKDSMMGLIRIAGIAGEVNVPTEMVPIAATFDLGKLDISQFRTDLIIKPLMAGMEQAMNPGAGLDMAAMYEGYTSPLEAGYDKLDWSGMSLDVSGLKLNTTAVTNTLTRNAEGVVVSSETPRATVTLKADQSGGMVGAMGLMVLAMGGYPSDTIEIYTEGKGTFDPEKDITRYSGFNVGVTDVADVKLDIGIVGLQQALPSLMAAISSAASMAGDITEPEFDEDGNPIEPDADADADAESDAMSDGSAAMAMQMLFALMPLQLSDLDLSITDETLMDLILSQQAIGAGQSLEEFRGDLVAMVQAASGFMTQAGVDQAIADELTAATAGFLAGPGTIRLQLKPQQPFGMMSAMMSPVTKESLGFSATFTPAAPDAAPEPAAPVTN